MSENRLFDLSEKVALVTGGSRGIGRSICETLARQGAYVAINYASNAGAAEETLAKIRAAGGDGEMVKFDVSSATEIDEAVDALHKKKGRLDIAVHNAGIAIDQLLLRVKQDDFDRTMATNLGGALWLSKSSVRLMMKARRGRIVLLSSVVAESGNPGQAIYSASKAALLGLTKTLAKEYASRGITVNAIAPGFIETDMTATLSAEMKQALVSQTPLGRMGSPADIANAVAYLVSDEAAFVTGQVLRVNGGLYV